jgi:hypothetical protein
VPIQQLLHYYISVVYPNWTAYLIYLPPPDGSSVSSWLSPSFLNFLTTWVWGHDFPSWLSPSAASLVVCSCSRTVFHFSQTKNCVNFKNNGTFFWNTSPSPPSLPPPTPPSPSSPASATTSYSYTYSAIINEVIFNIIDSRDLLLWLWVSTKRWKMKRYDRQLQRKCRKILISRNFKKICSLHKDQKWCTKCVTEVPMPFANQCNAPPLPASLCFCCAVSA